MKTFIGFVSGAALIVGAALTPISSCVSIRSVLAADRASKSDYSGMFDSFELDHSLRAGYWSGSRSLDGTSHIPASSFWLRSQSHLSDNLGVKAEGWVAGNRPYVQDAPRFELREGYLSWSGENADLKIGRQIGVWGRADRINPTDNLSSRDYTSLFPNDDDLRRGNLMVKGGYGIGNDYTVSAYWLPEFRPNVLPTQRGANFLPDQQGNDPTQFAVKLDRSGGGFDWSVSYFDGLDRSYDVKIVPAPSGELFFQRLYPRVRVFGADAATTFDRYGLRAEMAYVSTPDLNGGRADIRNSEWQGVVGVDRTFGSSFNVNFQYILRVVQDFRETDFYATPLDRAVAVANGGLRNQLDPLQHGVSARISDRFLNESLEVEAGNLVYAPMRQGVSQFKASYAISDTGKVIIGADYYYGDSRSYFGAVSKSSSGYLELRWGY
ncbi:DUF1302 domain-containing protein [Azospirillaceae bacterium]